MNRSTKAVLLSALVFPGAGHWYLRKKWQAIALTLASAAAVYVLMSGAIAQANLLAEKIVSGEVQPELGALTKMLTESTDAGETGSITMATLALGILWIIGIVDAWRSGKIQPTEN